MANIPKVKNINKKPPAINSFQKSSIINHCMFNFKKDNWQISNYIFTKKKIEEKYQLKQKMLLKNKKSKK